MLINIFDIIAAIIITLFWIYIAYKAKKNLRDARRELDEMLLDKTQLTYEQLESMATNLKS